MNNLPVSISRTSLIALSFVSVGLTGLNGSVTYSAFFNNGTGSSGDKNGDVYHWKTAVGALSVVDDTLATPNAVGVSQGVTNTAGVPVIGGASTSGGFFFAVPDSAPGAMLLYSTHQTTSTSFQDQPQGDWFQSGDPIALNSVSVGNLSSLSVYTRPASGSIDLRFAIQVGGSWYAGDSVFNQSDLNTYELRTIDASAESWLLLGSSTTLDADLSDNSPVTLSSSALVTGYGLYADTGSLSGTGARVRLDSFQVTAVPEPATVALFAGVLALGGVVLRRRLNS